MGFAGREDIENEAIKCIRKFGVGSCGPRAFLGKNFLVKFLRLHEIMPLRVGALRMSKYHNKNFQAQFLFHIKIKTTYQNILPTTEILELRSKRGSQ